MTAAAHAWETGRAQPALVLAGFLGRLIGWGKAVPAPQRTAASSLGHRLPAAMTLNAAAGLCLAAAAANASRTGIPYAIEAFYASIAMIFLPFAILTLHPDTARGARIAGIMALTTALFLVKLIREPVAFVDHDEFLHWSTANAIIEGKALFAPNSLLPVSPLYPGLELVTTAITSLSGLSVFQAATCLLAAARLVFMLSLFMAYERISGSARVAACGCLAYMGASTFLVFDSQFSYESLAVAFLAALLLADARAESEGRWRHVAFVILPLLGALAVTHHMTAFLAAAILCGVAVLECLRAGRPRMPASALAIAVASVLLPLGWSRLMGDPGKGYLGPVITGGLREAAQFLTLSGGRTLFVSEDGATAAVWQRAVTIASVGITCLGLLTGFLRAVARAGIVPEWRTLASLSRLRGWTNSRLLVLTFLTLAFPISILFRFTRSGWEIGNRIGPFSFIGIGIVVAVGVAAYWQSGSRTTGRTLSLSGAALCLFVGGIISAQGPRILVPATHQVSGDSASVEPMGIAAAEWARAWLGTGNLFVSDRINRLLLATYGRQDVATTLRDEVDTGDIVFSKTLGRREIAQLSDAGVDFVSVDLRLTQGLPVVGVYFDGGANDTSYKAPPPPSVLMKFNEVPGIGRAFDDGYIMTYDVRGIDARR